MPVDRSNLAQVGSIDDAVSFALSSNEQTQELLKKAKVTLSKLYRLVFPKLPQGKTLGEMTEAFFVDYPDPIEVLKRSSRIYGALLTFQLLMGHGVSADFEELSKFIPIEEDGSLVNLGQITKLLANAHASSLSWLRRTRRKLTKPPKSHPLSPGKLPCPRAAEFVMNSLEVVLFSLVL